MFKLSVISDEVSQDLERVAKFAKRFNLDGIEIRTVWNMPPQDLVERSSEIRKIMSKYDLVVPCIASPFFKADLDSEEEYKQHISILRRVIELAKSLDTNLIRIFTFWRKGPLDEYLDRILSKFEEPLDIVKEEGVIVAIENEPSTHVNNGRRLAQFLDALGNPKYVKALWDPGNDISDPEGEIPYPDGYNYVRGRIVHIHIKDAVRLALGKAEPRPVGEGDVDYVGQLKALIEDKYEGFLSLETHWRPKKKLTEEQLVKPGGAAFSEMGEEASEVCIKNLMSLIRKAEEL
ncbi:MAG: sugar phosphate isomerase/epimerase [Thermoprotei archaeon]|nr:MAG: sugar phosphate isomerase/epimerase [Thermoprotei archaeon]RLF19549.1 MAG: sugar phosphate isomerase/epimerase [Thermoprotei archaeon]